MRLSKFTPSLCTVEGGVFGGMYFYHSVCYFLPMSNATFGSSFSLGNPHSPFRREKGTSRFDIGLVFARPLSWVRCSFSWRWVGYLVGVRCFARLVLLAAGLLACFALRCASAWFFLVTTRHPFWFVFVPAEGNRFALGTGGIRWSLLVGGLGPVLSIPKLCFKPFRTRQCRNSFPGDGLFAFLAKPSNGLTLSRMRSSGACLPHEVEHPVPYHSVPLKGHATEEVLRHPRNAPSCASGLASSS